jgi:hypothetical protein
MNKIKTVGITYLIISITGIAAYALLLLNFTDIVIKISLFLFVTALLGLLGWVGFIMLTTPDTERK